MDKIIVICGLTASGKTSVAVRLAKLFDGEIVSADSRQVYVDLNIGTGKDLPKNAKIKYENKSTGKSTKYGFYLINGIRTWGYDLSLISNTYSVSQYKKDAKNIILSILKRKKLPIICGGTGLYIKELLYGAGFSDIPRNEKLRNSLKNKTREELYRMLIKVDRRKALSMNDSDNKNPRRLVRAIEIADYLKKGRSTPNNIGIAKGRRVLTIGLFAPIKYVENKIALRVKKRIENGFLTEARNLIEKGLFSGQLGEGTIGYKEWKEYNAGKVSMKEFIKNWILSERKYAKRQMTWFKKEAGISWFNIEEKGFKKKIEKEVGRWYHL